MNKYELGAPTTKKKDGVPSCRCSTVYFPLLQMCTICSLLCTHNTGHKNTPPPIALCPPDAKFVLITFVNTRIFFFFFLWISTLVLLLPIINLEITTKYNVQLTGGGGVPVDTRSGWIDKVDSIVLGGGRSRNGPMWMGDR